MGDNGQANVHCRCVDGNRQQKCSVACCCSTFFFILDQLCVLVSSLSSQPRKVTRTKLAKGVDRSLFRETLMDIRMLRDLDWPMSMKIYLANLHWFRTTLEIIEVYLDGKRKGMWPVAVFVCFMNRAYSNGNLFRHWPVALFVPFINLPVAVSWIGNVSTFQ